MDWGTIIFGAVAAALGIGFLLLLVLALRRLTRKKSEEGEDADEGPGGEDASLETEADAGGAEVDAGTEADADAVAEADAEVQGRVEPVEKAAPVAPKPSPRRRPDTQEEKRRLTLGLAKTRGGFIARLGSLFKSKPELDAEMVDRIEEILFTADIGVRTTQELIDGLRTSLGKKEIREPSSVWAQIRRHSNELLELPSAAPLDVTRSKPFVILVVGVNGTGKTTTIGKLAALYKGEGLGVVLAAGDTFRAAATEQLEVWGERSGCPVVKGKEGADPTSVIVDGLKQVQNSGADLLIADTAGRLHTKLSLMEEIQKVRRSIEKRLPGAPHETFLVLDATMGQNAIAQAKMFKEALDITGLVLTKLDGTAKGGVVLGICNELKIPVRFIGIGEAVADLREFDSRAFVEALYEAAEA
jgi:fused signal recognition particle receptor